MSQASLPCAVKQPADRKNVYYSAEIVEFIRSDKNTPRVCEMDPPSLQQIREKLDKHLKNSYLKRVQAPIGVKPVLRAWMELN